MSTISWRALGRRTCDSAADLLLGARCPGCDRPGYGLCAACQAEVCAGRIRFAGRDPSPRGFPLTVCAGDYTGAVRRLIAGFKDEALIGSADELAGRLALAAAHLLATVGRPGSRYCLVPIPSLPAAVRERGLDHTHVLARATARRLRREVGLVVPVTRLLAARGRGPDQAGLDAAARQANRRNHFVVRAPPGLAATRGRLEGRVPILVDDVTTTGATLASAALALTEAGAPPLGAIVVAATIKRYGARAQEALRSGPRASS